METSSGAINNGLVWCLIGAACIVVGGYFLFFRKKGKRNFLDFNILSKLIPFPEAKKLEVITLSDIIGWFKEPEINEFLSSNPNLEAVAVLDRKNAKIEVALCVFDKEKGKVEKIEVLQAPTMDESARLQFGDKSMLVLK